MKSINIDDQFGVYRSQEPPHVLPLLAWKLDTSLPIRDNELLIRVRYLNVNAASFTQLKDEAQGDVNILAQKIVNLVAIRGKLHNSITGSGGTIMGVVEEVGRRHPDFGKIFPGDRICTLISSAMTPLVIHKIHQINMKTGQVELDGYAILFENSIYAPVPDHWTPNLFLALIGEAGSCYESYLLCKKNMTVVVINAMEKVGIISLFALREKLGTTGRLIATIQHEEDKVKLASLHVADQIIPIPTQQPLAAYKIFCENSEDTDVDLIIDCSHVNSVELFSVLLIKPNGTIYFTNPASQCATAGLGAEGIAKEVNLLFYRGYIRGHVTFCINLVNRNPDLRAFLSERYIDNGGGFTRVEISGKEMQSEEKGLAGNIVVAGQTMQNIINKAKKVAPFDATVLITGESGTGKEILADIIYQYGGRTKKPFVKINCAAISDSLFESEMFGYDPGSFTGALKNGRQGYFEKANGGTLFLDEIGEMSLQNQVKLLRVLQTKEIIHVGGNQPIPVDVRIIAATNRDLQSMVSHGEFREDLFYRLNVITLRIPALRERREDIIPLTENFCQRFNSKYHIHKQFDGEALRVLEAYEWPGNIREMENLILRLMLCTENEQISADIVRAELKKQNREYESRGDNRRTGSNDGQYEPVNLNERETSRKTDEENEEAIYRRAAGKWRTTREIAKDLGVSQSTVVRKLKKFGIVLTNK